MHQTQRPAQKPVVICSVKAGISPTRSRTMNHVIQPVRQPARPLPIRVKVQAAASPVAIGRDRTWNSGNDARTAHVMIP